MKLRITTAQALLSAAAVPPKANIAPGPGGRVPGTNDLATEDPAVSRGPNKVAVWSYPIAANTDIRGRHPQRSAHPPLRRPRRRDIANLQFLDGNPSLGDAVRLDKSAGDPSWQIGSVTRSAHPIGRYPAGPQWSSCRSPRPRTDRGGRDARAAGLREPPTTDRRQRPRPGPRRFDLEGSNA